MRGPTYWTWRAAGSPVSPECEDAPGLCWVCGDEADRTIDRTAWMGSSYTGQNRVRAPHGSRVCEPCVYLHARVFRDAAGRLVEVPGRPAKDGKQPPNWRNYSVLVEVLGDVPHLTTASKGEKPQILAWLRPPKRGPWFAAITDSGQKHVVPSPR